MTVRELIAALSAYNPDARVFKAIGYQDAALGISHYLEAIGGVQANNESIDLDGHVELW